jgi:phosphatidate cytidylyltransferase
MALNWQTFKQRTISALVFMAVMLSGLVWNRWSFFLLFTIIHFAAWREYQRLVPKIAKGSADASSIQKFSFAVAGWCLLLYFTNQELQVFGVFISSVGWWLGLAMMFLLPLTAILHARPYPFVNTGYLFFGLFYISLPLGLMINLRNYWTEEYSNLNLVIPLLVIFTLWLNDTLAYLTGSLVGKTRLSSISPKKTWEGTIGGIVLSAGVMCFVAFYTQLLSVGHTAAIALLSSICGTFGDLFQSKLKRMAGVKDSGSMMPGHGGFLDRFDSLLFASVVVWFYVNVAMQ